MRKPIAVRNCSLSYSISDISSPAVSKEMDAKVLADGNEAVFSITVAWSGTADSTASDITAASGSGTIIGSTEKTAGGGKAYVRSGDKVSFDLMGVQKTNPQVPKTVRITVTVSDAGQSKVLAD